MACADRSEAAAPETGGPDIKPYDDSPKTFDVAAIDAWVGRRPLPTSRVIS
jgi:hypothetical protein